MQGLEFLVILIKITNILCLLIIQAGKQLEIITLANAIGVVRSPSAVISKIVNVHRVTIYNVLKRY